MLEDLAQDYHVERLLEHLRGPRIFDVERVDLVELRSRLLRGGGRHLDADHVVSAAAQLLADVPWTASHVEHAAPGTTYELEDAAGSSAARAIRRRLRVVVHVSGVSRCGAHVEKRVVARLRMRHNPRQ